MKLAELLKVDTTKENWFKLLSKKGINPKTVNTVSKGGEGNDSQENTDEWYYYKFIPGDILPDMSAVFEVFMEMKISHNVYFLSKYHGGDDNITELPIIGVANNYDNYLNKLINYFKFSKEKSLFYELRDASIKPIGWLEGNWVERLRKFLGDMEEVEQIIEAYSQSFVEISKEEYESLITYRVE